MLKENMFQNWRAVGINETDKCEHLLCLGKTYMVIQKNYIKALDEVLTPDEKQGITKISMQMWHGMADRGFWKHKSYLAMSIRNKTIISRGVITADVS